MSSWQWTLLLKPLAVLFVALCYYVLVYKGSHFLGRLIPDGKVKDFLFRERGDGNRTATGRELK